MADTTIRSEMAGSVWQVLVKVGDRIEADVPLVLLESMKMEIPVVSPDPSDVTEIHVAEGDPILTIRT